MKQLFWMGGLCLLAACGTVTNPQPDSISGIYPSLAYYNNEGECGTGAVVPWAGSLWVITYGPHLPNGSSDKLYEIKPDMSRIIHEESIGGTPANRMIHPESNQLFIGPYAIDAEGKVRVIPYTEMPGRHTGNARHLTDPAHRILYGTMEEGFYDVDVNTLQVTELYPDGNALQRKKNDTDAGPINDLLPGVHGKGFYSGQGVAVFANNGEGTQEALQKFDVEAGVLAEWDGKEWTVVRRNQFTEVTGPGGISGNTHPESDLIWSLGWDYKSLLLGVREAGKGWSFYRLPKASHSYDGAHGWNTEWPRIRNVGTDETPDYLMTMHGMFWHFPGDFSSAQAVGIRPRSAYLKVIGDFARWQDGLVFGCDDSAQKEFLNKRKAKGSIEGPGQSNSNLWFTPIDQPDHLGPTMAEGAVWAKETVKAGVPSEPFLFAGWDDRCCWIKNEGTVTVTYTLEVDPTGNGDWRSLKQYSVEAGKALHVPFDNEQPGEWIRVVTDKDVVSTTVSFNYASHEDRVAGADNPLFAGLCKDETSMVTGGLLYGLGDDRRALGLLAYAEKDGVNEEVGYYEMGDRLTLVRKDDQAMSDFIRTKFAIPQHVITIDNGSVLVVDDKNRRWRMPIANEAYRKLTEQGRVRICREVATERDLFAAAGTFFELPAENADGYAKIRPVASHPYFIHDYASYRGMLLLTGVDPVEGKNNPHVILSEDGKAAVWAGVIDDLWTMGKPYGKGGPWYQMDVKAGEPSDPYLMAGYSNKSLSITTTSVQPVAVRMEVDPTGNGDWMEAACYQVSAAKPYSCQLEDKFQARWVRFVADQDANVTTCLEYK